MIKKLIPDYIDIASYNCAGFALGFFTWIDLNLDLKKLEKVKKKEDYIFKHLMKLLNSTCLNGTVRDITSRDMLAPDEYLVLFRCNPDGEDVHFIKEHKGKWYEKCGETYPQEVPSRDLFHDKWDWSPTLDFYLEDADKTFMIAVKQLLPLCDSRNSYCVNNYMYLPVENMVAKQAKEDALIPIPTEEITIYPTEELAKAHANSEDYSIFVIAHPFGVAESWLEPDSDQVGFRIATKNMSYKITKSKEVLIVKTANPKVVGW